MTTITGLIGFPTAHSLSPRIHAYWLRQYGIDAEYKLFTTPPHRLRQTLHHLHKKNWRGVNVTVPHKEAVQEYLDRIDPIATRIGAVNTITNDRGTLTGSNTDAYGFLTSLREGLGDLSAHLSSVLILGAGGAARAVIAALHQAGATHITVTNRTPERAQQLADDFSSSPLAGEVRRGGVPQKQSTTEGPLTPETGDTPCFSLSRKGRGGITALPWHLRDDAAREATLLINTTSLGMQGHAPLDLVLTKQHRCAVADIVYAPFETPLLRDARALGLSTVDGVGMLLYQAQAAFELWHGVRPDVTPELRSQVLKGDDSIMDDPMIREGKDSHA